jgi:hypothetical protein
MKEKAVLRNFDQNCHLVGLNRQTGHQENHFLSKATLDLFSA